MRRTSLTVLTLVLPILIGGLLFGCDESPTSVRDFDIQPALDTPSERSLSLVGDPSVTFNVVYQGFDAHPSATGEGELSLEKVDESGTPSEGEQTWKATFGGQIGVDVQQRSVAVTGESGGRQVTDSLTINISRDVLLRQFTNDYLVVADYEEDQRSFSASGGTQAETKEQNSITDVNSSGTNYLNITSSPSGSATVTSRTNAANADRFSLLIRPDPSTDFNLTLTFTEEKNGSTTTHDITFPVPSGSDWFRYQVGIEQVSSDFNPVAQRAGGDGPLVDVSLSTDKQVEFAVDELRFADANGPLSDVHDFDTTDLAYGPPFCPPSFGATNDVADESGGFTARTVEGEGCFGYNYSGVNVNVDANDVLAFRVRASAESELAIFLNTPQGAGGFGGLVTRTLSTGGWTTVEVPIGELGDAPAALNDPGISNFGFEAGSGSDFAIDDIRIETRE